MKIGEASRVYSAKLRELDERRDALYEQKKALEDGRLEMTDDEVTALGKAIDRVELSRESVSEVMAGINTQKTFLESTENSKRAGEAAAKQAEEYSKCLEVARRIARGDKVPPKDEQKLLEFSSEMYQMAKNMASAVQNEKAKEHKSLWENEDDAAPEKTVDETVNEMECTVSAPPEISADLDIQ